MFRCFDINKFSIHYRASLEECLAKFEESKVDTIFAIDDKNRAVASITDGDIRRELLSGKSVLPSRCAFEIGNKNFKYVNSLTLPSTFGEIDLYSIPNLDDNNQIKFIYTALPTPIELGNHLVTQHSETFIIAEIGNNHQGSVEAAFKLIDQAKASNANCVKFQHRNIELIYGKNFKLTKTSGDLSAQYVAHLLDKYQLEKSDLFKCFDYAKKIGIQVTCTPFDIQSLKDLQEYGMDFFKISSADFFNEELTNEVLNSGKPALLSTGMSKDVELKLRLQRLATQSHNFIPLHCTSSYPTPYSSVNLRYLNTIKNQSNGHVGYSGHELGYEVTIAAVTLGAKVIEKHFTLDKTLEGNDHKVSLLPTEFTDMVKSIRNVEIALVGDSNQRIVSQGEVINEVALKKGAYANKELRPGKTFEQSDVSFRSPRLGLSISEINNFYGKSLTKKIVAGEPINSFAFQQNKRCVHYEFKHEIGVPVRYNEIQNIKNLFNCAFYEYHLSCHDIGQERTFESQLSLVKNFSVHAPELFFNDHLIDLSSLDNDYRQQSIGYIERVVNATERLKLQSKRTDPVNIIINVGGFSETNFINDGEKKEKYELVAGSLSTIDFKDNIPLIQTMPPYPWHFGGRRFHNLFVHPNEIDAFCERYNHKVCFDTSHTGMAANYFNFDLYECLLHLKKYIKHLHIADFEGLDGEGIKTGSGDLKIKLLLDTIESAELNVPMVIEEWQGHLNSYAGFENALTVLKENNF